ncbi:hypothetical protein SCE1572_05975 [Sorangium cellulosum So0157-2]|uniref:Uncharacterized protein n=1 Tax=Sorangium cellulosum So0157-2 TaxID=1254432 RepID=S4XQH4_SORCE|nr:hypothetical protein SCE1572_05975 [Sorangium cellulosum So0157-2]
MRRIVTGEALVASPSSDAARASHVDPIPPPESSFSSS